jgi:SNF2 family DNA or RNA helicase
MIGKLVYDIFCNNNKYNNEKIINFTLEDIYYTDNYTELTELRTNRYIDKKFKNLKELDNLYTIKIFQNNNIYVTIIELDYQNFITYDLNNLPNKTFFHSLCVYHLKYTNSNTNETHQILKENNMIKRILDKTTSTLDKSINESKIDFINVKLFDYQKRSVQWMLEKELKSNFIYEQNTSEIKIGDYFYNINKGKSYKIQTKSKITFNGGALIDEVGLGKTLQMTALSLLNSPQNLSYYQYDENNKLNNKLFSKATLILCPNNLCKQWEREINKMIKESMNLTIVTLLTKTHFNKYTYLDILNADFVILSYNFLENNAVLANIKETFETQNNYKLTKTFYKNSENISNFNIKFENVLNTLANSNIIDHSNLLSAQVNPFIIHWNRIIVDEFHEIYNISKYKHMKTFLPFFSRTFSWCVTGTPFDNISLSQNCFKKILEFITQRNFENYDSYTYYTKELEDYICLHNFRRNTKESIKLEYTLPPIEEEVILLKFTHTERMMYTSYLANIYNDKYSIYLRQLCCYPKLSDELKDLLSDCASMKDIERIMITYYQNIMNKSLTKVNIIDKQIDSVKHKIEVLTCKINLKNTDNNTDNNIENISDIYEEIKIEELHELHESHELMIGGKMTLQNLEIYLKKLIERRVILFKDYDGKKTTSVFFQNVVTKIKNTNNKNANKEECIICLDQIPEDNISVTKCGHIYCYTCINQVFQTRGTYNKCPYCKRDILKSDIYKISFEKEKEKSTEDLVNLVGTKIANLINYLKKNDHHTIIFSQWDNLLKKVGETLKEHGIKNIFCKGSVYQRDKALREFSYNNTYKVIMLSSTSAASGANLTRAKQVILLDPVYGSYEFRKNTEWQSIGRAYRMGQQNKVKVIRFIIKDTVEEDIYNENIAEDSKYSQSPLKI